MTPKITAVRFIESRRRTLPVRDAARHDSRPLYPVGPGRRDAGWHEQIRSSTSRADKGGDCA